MAYCLPSCLRLFLIALACAVSAPVQAKDSGSADAAIFLAQQALEADKPDRAWPLLAEAAQLAKDNPAALERIHALTLRLNADYPAHRRYIADNRILAILPDRGDGTVSAVTLGRKLFHFDSETGVELGQQPLTESKDAAERALLDSLGGAATAKALGLDGDNILQALIDSDSARVEPMGPQHFAFGNSLDVSVFRRDNGAGIVLGRNVTWAIFDDLVAMLSGHGYLSVQRVRPNGTQLAVQEIANADLERCHPPADFDAARNTPPCTAKFVETEKGDLLLFYQSWNGLERSIFCLRIGDPVASEQPVDALPIPINAQQAIAVRRDAKGVRADLVALDCALTPQGTVSEYAPHGASTPLLAEPGIWWNPEKDLLVGFDRETGMAVQIRRTNYSEDGLSVRERSYADGIASVAVMPGGEMLIGTAKATVDIYSAPNAYPSHDFLDGDPIMSLKTDSCDAEDAGFMQGNICAISMVLPSKDHRHIDVARGDGVLFRLPSPIPSLALEPGQSVIGAGLRDGAPVVALLTAMRGGEPLTGDHPRPDDQCHLQVRGGAANAVFDDVRGLCSTFPNRILFRPGGRFALGVGRSSSFFEVGRWADGKSIEAAVCGAPAHDCSMDSRFTALRDGTGFAVAYHGRLLDTPARKEDGLALISGIDGTLMRRITDPILQTAVGQDDQSWRSSKYIDSFDVKDGANYVLAASMGSSSMATLIVKDGKRRYLPNAAIDAVFDRPDCLSMTPGDRLYYAKSSPATVVFDLAKGRIDAGEEALRHRFVCAFSDDFQRMQIDYSIRHAPLDAPIVRFTSDNVSVVYDNAGANAGGLIWNRNGYMSWIEPPADAALADWLRITAPATLMPKHKDHIAPGRSAMIDNGRCFAAPDWLFDPDRTSNTALLIEWWKNFQITGDMADRMDACIGAKARTGRQHYQRGLGIAVGSGLMLRALNDEALKDFETAARQNYRSALLGQAIIWMFRKDGQSDPVKARALLDAAWERKVPAAATLQGLLYEADWLAGDEAARSQAQSWFLRSACAGEPLAFSRLASMVEQDMRSNAVAARLLIDVPHDLGCGFPLAADAPAARRLLAFLSAAMLLAPAEESINSDTGWRKSNLARAMAPQEAIALQRALDGWVAGRRRAKR